VGTIDQALMAVMNVKHNFVRAFGLAGKVVILDEVHSYDSYTGTILDTLVKQLWEMGCTVIILSATLTGERRRQLLGISTNVPVPEYPLITALSVSLDEPLEIHVEAEQTPELTVRRITKDTEAIEEALARAEQGQQVLWIENVVDEAQKLYERISARALECGVDTGLLHSRFIQWDRDIKEKKWVALFGEDEAGQRSKQGRILIGTQILEQSLDIDADFLITRLCPTDMLLQRIGRLWRHRDTIRPSGACAEVWILAADYADILKNIRKLGKTAAVYARYLLLRTLEVWDRVSTLQLPDAIRSLVEETYAERRETGLLNDLKTELKANTEKLRDSAFLGISKFGKAISDIHAKTRYSEIERQEVLLFSKVIFREDKSLVLVFPDGENIELSPHLNERDRAAWRERAAALNRHIVVVPEKYAPLSALPKNLELLKDYTYIETGKDGLPSLRIALLRESGEITGFDYTSVSKDFELSYDSRLGYVARKIDKTEEEDTW
jgi:CRISPR-associated endonuclease/helicase Cas3